MITVSLACSPFSGVYQSMPCIFFTRGALADSETVPPLPSALVESDSMTEVAELDSTIVTLTTDIVAAHVTNNSVAVSDLPLLIRNVHDALNGLGRAEATQEVKQEPAVSVRASVRPDYIVCLEDGKKLKMLKRHLMTHYQLTPAEYRTKWNLPADYPMVAPNYAEQRRTLAKQIGLARQPKGAVTPKAAKAPTPRRTRKKAPVAEKAE